MEVIKWLSVIFILMLSVVGGYCFHSCSLLYRIIVVVLLIVLAGYVLLSTRYAKMVIVFYREAYKEVCEVIWPTWRESLYVTVIVIVVTFLLSLVLWGLDSILVYVVSLGLRI